MGDSYSIVQYVTQDDGKQVENCLVKLDDLNSEFWNDYYQLSKARKIYGKGDLLQVSFDAIIKSCQKDSGLESLNSSFLAFLGSISPYLYSLRDYCTDDYYSEVTGIFFDTFLSYRLFSLLRNISQHKPNNINIQTDLETKRFVLVKNILFKDFKIPVARKNDTKDLLPEKIEIIPHLNTFYINLLELKEWIFVKNFNKVRQLEYLSQYAKFMRENSWLKVANEDKRTITYYQFNNNYKELILNMIDIYNRCSVIDKPIGYKFPYTNFFNFLDK